MASMVESRQVYIFAVTIDKVNTSCTLSSSDVISDGVLDAQKVNEKLSEYISIFKDNTDNYEKFTQSIVCFLNDVCYKCLEEMDNNKLESNLGIILAGINDLFSNQLSPNIQDSITKSLQLILNDYENDPFWFSLEVHDFAYEEAPKDLKEQMQRFEVRYLVLSLMIPLAKSITLPQAIFRAFKTIIPKVGYLEKDSSQQKLLNIIAKYFISQEGFILSADGNAYKSPIKELLQAIQENSYNPEDVRHMTTAIYLGLKYLQQESSSSQQLAEVSVPIPNAA